MINYKNCLVSVLVLLSFYTAAQKIHKLKQTHSIGIAIPEPSDICINPLFDTFFIVSDAGVLFETDIKGKIIHKSLPKEADFEAVYANENSVFAVDETHRTIYEFDNTSLIEKKVVSIPYQGGRNKGYEALTFNMETKKFILLTEKDPILLFELDLDFKITKEISLNSIAKDISSATFHNGFLWLLSDENMTLMKLNPNSYEVLQKWSLPVINPEGFAFDKQGNLLVTCDDMQRIYYFNNPEKN